MPNKHNISATRGYENHALRATPSGGIAQWKARSAYAFIAVCDSARTSGIIFPSLRRVAVRHCGSAAPLRGARMQRLSQPCAVAHGYKRISATRLHSPGGTGLKSKTNFLSISELFNY
jgi:hypothetical protein